MACLWSRPVRALWIEISAVGRQGGVATSRPVRALWIEIASVDIFQVRLIVEAREGLVD